MPEVEHEVMRAVVKRDPRYTHLSGFEYQVKAVRIEVTECLILRLPPLERNDDLGRVFVLDDAVIVRPINDVVTAILKLCPHDVPYVVVVIDGGGFTLSFPRHGAASPPAR